jgi:beta-lactamase regulating signal transducer with metallopeptidase domain
MHFIPTRAMYYFGVHLLFASIVCLLTWLLTAIPRGRTTTKYWIWVAATLNFMIPLGAVADSLGRTHLGWATPLPIIGGPALAVTQGPNATLLFAIWLLGASLMSIRLIWRLRADSCNARGFADVHPLSLNAPFVAAGVPVRFTEGHGGPAVDGVLHPHISLPKGIEHLLSKEELAAVLMHEVTHAKRRDNLIRLVYEVGLCVLWFHPLVWLAGSRLTLYRELSCDEPVIQSARGLHLLSALNKLAAPEHGFLLQATASSFLTHRLSMLRARPGRPSGLVSALLALAFGTLLVGGVLETVAHTACCFVSKGERRGTQICPRASL